MVGWRRLWRRPAEPLAERAWRSWAVWRSAGPPVAVPRRSPHGSPSECGVAALRRPARRGWCRGPQQRYRRGCSRKTLSTWMCLLQLACLGSSWHVTREAIVSNRTL